MAGEADDTEVIDRPVDDAASGDDAQQGREPDAHDSDEAYHAAAKIAGWKDDTEWKGDTAKRLGAKAYLEQLAGKNKSLREQVDRTVKVAAKAIETNRTKAMEAAEKRIAEAAEAGDADAAKEAAEDLKKAAATSSAPTEFDNFSARNDWFNTDQAATALAIAAAQKVADKNGSAKEQFEAAEAEVKKRFPELFSDTAQEDRPSRAAPHVQAGSRTTGAPRKKGWSDMPTAAQAVNEKAFVKKGLMTREEIAEAYWEDHS